MRYKIFSFIASALLICIFTLTASHAQEIELKKTSEKKYVDATLQNLSQLYWALDRLDIGDDDNVTNFLMINQCEIYKEYRHNEFHWGNIKKFAREYIESNEKKFPVRFEFMQPLRLGNYDFDQNGFVLEDKYAIDGIRRFEIPAEDAREDVCGQRARNIIKNYPKGLLIELSRPVFFELMPMDVQMANEYINEKSIEYKKLSPKKQQYTNIYNFRDIYIVFKVRFFGTAGDHYSKTAKENYARTLGVLEKIEVYDDINRDVLLYEQDFNRQKKKKKKNDMLKQLKQGKIEPDAEKDESQ